MKLLKLETLNIASLEGENTIDFESGLLGESQIFSIVGPTGSGKSTILDAICLALYGRAPRYPLRPGQRNQKIEIIGEADKEENKRLAPTDPRNVMTRGKRECYCKLTFLANDGREYRAEWSVRFGNTKFQPAETRLFRLDPTGPVEDDWSSLPDSIIGLDFDQFLRTVLIAQGSFAGFLAAKEGERCALLEKLVGNGNLYKAITEEVKKNKDAADEQLRVLDARCGGYRQSLLDDEALAAVQRRIKELGTEREGHRRLEKRLDEALHWYITDEQQKNAIAGAEEAKKAAEERLEQMDPQRARLALHDATLGAVSVYRTLEKDRKDIADATKRQKELAASLQRLDLQIAEEKTGLEQRVAAVAAAKAELAKQQPHIHRARELKVEVTNAERAVQEKTAALGAAVAGQNAADRAVADNRAAIVKATADWEKCTKLLADGEELAKAHKAKLKQALDAAAKLHGQQLARVSAIDPIILQRELETARQAQSDLTRAIDIRRRMTEKAAECAQKTQRQANLTERNQVLAAQLKELEAELGILRADVEALERTYTLMTSEDWERHRADLRDDEPCPLCGAKHHPYATAEAWRPVQDDLNRKLKERKQTLRAQEARERELTNEQQMNGGELSALAKAIPQLAQEEQRLAAEWTQLAQAHAGWQSDEAWLAEQKPRIDREALAAGDKLADYNRMATEERRLLQVKDQADAACRKYEEEAALKLAQQAEQKNKAHTQLETLKGQTENLLRQQADRQQAAEAAQAACDDASKQLSKMQALLRAEIGERDPETYERGLNEAVAQAETQEAAQRNRVADLEKQKTGHEGALNTVMEALTRTEATRVEHQTALDRWVAGYNATHGFALTEADIATLATATDDWEAVRALILQGQQDVTAAQTTYANAVSANRTHQASKPEETKDDATESKTRLAALAEETEKALAGEQARLQLHEEATAQLGALTAQLQEARTCADDWKEIYDAIGKSDGDTLRKTAQIYTLGFLIAHANAEIRKFSPRYELVQVKNSLGMRVIDHDRFDDCRDTTTLSGGETFIVSLGLALGLSSLSSKNIAFSNLFIDEGFGTLDPDTLSVVLNALSLMQSSQGKKVGVISHTDTMAEQITTQIQVIKRGNSGTSYVRIATAGR